ncbi:MAG: Fis family transcriptional regulator [Proteobacteria bacterium]|nr:Fis family transcriptional regulator [Pseudomonadota bacterium]MDA1332395.1 Fis family transcriptional regulator [Pseudomonadota bacterium]
MSTQSDLSNAVKHAVESYFKDLEGEKAHGIYNMVIDTVEKTLVEDILKRSDGNQSEAAQKLGLNRNTLRAKMKKFNVL